MHVLYKMVVLKKSERFKENVYVRVLLQELFFKALLKRDATTDILQGIFQLLKTLSRKTPLKNMLEGIFICLVRRVTIPCTELRKGNCQSLMYKIL